MKKTAMSCVFYFLLLVNGYSQFIYLNPQPNSSFHNPQVTLTIKNGEVIDEASVSNNNFIEMVGTKSGKHSYRARLSDDQKTIVVHPQPAFKCGETVSVSIHSNLLKKKTGEFVNGINYTFNVREEYTPEQTALFQQADREFYNEAFGRDTNLETDLRDENIDSLPTYTIGINNNASPGQIFYRNRNAFLADDVNCFSTIIENDGSLVWARNLGTLGFDFKINTNGYLTYFNDNAYGSGKYWMVMDSNYTVFDSLQGGNGLDTFLNFHDIAMYPDGHTLLLIFDKRIMDLTQYGGKVDAAVTGVKIQELDVAKDEIWEWSGWDHFELTDAGPKTDLTGYLVDYVHANAVSRDDDGNIILSSRSIDEVSKIDRETSEFIWRLGGEKNQFTFVGDNIPEHFSHQHDARRMANGNLMLYNNGNFLVPFKSSSKEYNIDETNKIATLVWFYEHPDVNNYPVNSQAQGSSQRLPNGNTIIGWGQPNANQNRPAITEVDPNKNIVWEMNLDEYGQNIYRVHKYDWRPCEIPKSAQITVTKITNNSCKVNWAAVNNAVSYDLQYRKLGKVDWKLKNITKTSKKLQNLTADKSYEFQLRTHCLNGYTSDYAVLDTFTTLPARLIQEETPMITIELYPNPTSGLLYLSAEGIEKQNLSFSIYDLAGKVIFSFDLPSASAGENILGNLPAGRQGENLKIDVSILPAGIYFAQIKINSQMQTIKFVKQ